MANYYAVTYSFSLAHHGIKGQKWGKRNGPPYPLDAEDHSAREKKAGWRASLKRKKNDMDRQIVRRAADRHMTTPPKAEKTNDSDERRKKLIKAGLIVAGTALVAYGAYRLYRSHNAIQFIKPTKEAVEKLTKKEILDETGIFKYFPGVRKAADEVIADRAKGYKDLADLKITDASQLKKWASTPSIKDVSQSVNPGFTDVMKEFDVQGRDFSKLSYNDKVNILSEVPEDRTQNCMYCSIAYEMNRRGYDVIANGRKGGGFEEEIVQMFKLKDDVMTFDTKYGNANTYLKKFSQMGNGARGIMGVSWKSGGGHALAWEVVDNNLNIIDCQDGHIYKNISEVKELISKTKGTIDTFRTDNAEPIWNDMLLRSLAQR